MRNSKKNKGRKPWKQSDFPNENSSELQFHCADCKSSNDRRKCRKCGRDCWKWCGTCGGFKYTRHSCFQANRTIWNSSDFPIEKKGEFYCGTCKKTNPSSGCRCGRMCWEWCDDCNRYRHRGHDTCGESSVPTTRINDTDSYYCKFCEISSKTLDCKKCGRKKCLRWCDDCEGYFVRASHGCFGSYRKESRCTSSDFPTSKDGKYHCGKCKIPSRLQKCTSCNRTCWKWCSVCTKYVSPNKGHFSTCGNEEERTKVKIKHKAYKVEDFPNSHSGKYFCADCEIECGYRCSKCGRNGWKWCEGCECYKNHNHVCDEDEDEDDDDDDEEEEEDSSTSGSKRKRVDDDVDLPLDDDESEPPTKKLKLD